MTPEIGRLLSAARVAASGDYYRLSLVAQAMAELGDPHGPEVAEEIERLLGRENAGYAATFYALFDRREDIERLAAVASEAHRSFVVEAFERIGDHRRADELAPDSPAVYEALARGDTDRIAEVVSKNLARLGESYENMMFASDILAKTGDRDGAIEYLRRAEARWTPKVGNDVAEQLVGLANAYAELGLMDDAVRIARDAEARAYEPVHVSPPRKPRKHRPNYLSSAIPALARIHVRAGDIEHASAMIEKHAQALLAWPGNETRAAAAYAEVGEIAEAKQWLERPFRKRDHRQVLHDSGMIDSLHAHAVRACLTLGEPAQAIEHAARIAEPSQRVYPILAIARWVATHEVPDLEAALAHLDAAPLEGPAWMP